MKIKYIYIKDDWGRIKEIYPADEENLKRYKEEDGYYNYEFEESEIKNIKFGLDGLVDGHIQYIGYTQEELYLIETSRRTERIQLLKQMLQETDWKVIVNSELIQEGLPPKYLNLHEERQAWRDEINQLEQQINSLQNN
jgi:hypothetical protein